MKRAMCHLRQLSSKTPQPSIFGDPSAKAKTNVIDVRSDTVTKPTEAVRQAMFSAVVGDDVYGEDPTVNESATAHLIYIGKKTIIGMPAINEQDHLCKAEFGSKSVNVKLSKLQKTCAHLFGKEASIFVPTGTMANLIAVMAHCGRGEELIIGDKQHMFLYEQGGYAQFANVCGNVIPNDLDGTIGLTAVENAIRDRTDSHCPISRLICLENTHNVCGGVPLSIDYVEKMRALANRRKLVIHMDGARVANASVALDEHLATIVKPVDSVSMCFSKGLGCPAGSILAGSEEFIKKAHRFRKGLGGGMRQTGVLAAAALESLKTYRERLTLDHQHTRFIAEKIMAPNFDEKGALSIDLSRVRTNVILVRINADICSPQTFAQKLAEEVPDSGLPRVLCLPFSASSVRLVLHSDISPTDVEHLLARFEFVLKSL